MSVKPSPIATATADISSLSAENFITPSKEGKKDDIGLDLNDVVLTDEVKGLLTSVNGITEKEQEGASTDINCWNKIGYGCIYT